MSQTTQSNRLIAGKYLTREPVGAGGGGTVYRAEELSTGRTVAIKLRSRDLADTLEKEAAALEGIAHPHVLKALAHGVDGEIAYLVTELVPGETLRELVRRESPLPLERVLGIFGQLASAVAALHERGMVHADLKSANVMVGPDGHVTLLDFGLAHRPTGLRPSDTWGTPEYLAPELILGDAPSPTSDSYALGILLYELCCGETPFSCARSLAVLSGHLREEPEPPASRCPVRPLPRALEAVILRALTKAPARRYPDAASLLAAVLESRAPRVERIRAAVRRGLSPRRRAASRVRGGHRVRRDRMA
jgi:serine/threonine-protein kinase